jgi:8-oxo-dGTP pyrophosphatase MutT (NUDIX family)
MPTYTDESYGAVVISSSRKVLLIKQRSFHSSYWGLPKGHKNEGEDAADAAIREVNEECGTSLKRSNLVDGFWTSESYQYRGPLHNDAWLKHKSFPNASRRPSVNYDKTVYYALAKVDGEPETKPQADEVDEVGWYPIHEALRMLKHEAQRDVLRRLYGQI